MLQGAIFVSIVTDVRFAHMSTLIFFATALASAGSPMSEDLKRDALCLPR